MSSNESFKKYAALYDLLYQDKNYGAETDFVEEVFKRFKAEPVKTVLDVSVGTGGHALMLAHRGYTVTGFDYSKEMVDIARQKAQQLNLRLDLTGGVSMTQLPAHIGHFDAIISLFSSVGYLAETGELELFLNGAKQLLKSDGILVFDYWNGIACTNDHAQVRTKEVTHGLRKIVRVSNTRLEPMNNQAWVEMRCQIFENQKLADEFVELHKVRYFYPREVNEKLITNGYKVLGVFPFNELNRGANESDWYLTVVAQRG